MFAKVKKILDRALEVLVTVSMGVLVVDVVWQVFTRYVLRDPSDWTEELATFLMIWVGLLGASVALNRGAHLGIDYFTLKLSPRQRLWTELFVFFCVALFSLLVLVIGGVRLVSITLQNNQVSPALGLKMGHVYLALPISGFFLVLYSVEFFTERIVALVRGKQVQQAHDFESTAAMD
ncbi:MAG: TRAP transporter small permease [Planctomycetota bacterium]|jgi:TRAP-type C4-dicarboxylate transport system permease small subunit